MRERLRPNFFRETYFHLKIILGNILLMWSMNYFAECTLKFFKLDRSNLYFCFSLIVQILAFGLPTYLHSFLSYWTILKLHFIWHTFLQWTVKISCHQQCYHISTHVLKIDKNLYQKLSPNVAFKLKKELDGIKHCWGVYEQNDIVNKCPV